MTDLKELVTQFIIASGAVVAFLTGLAKAFSIVSGVLQRRAKARSDQQVQQEAREAEGQRWEIEAIKELVQAQRDEIDRCHKEAAQMRVDQAAERERWGQERDRIHKENERLTVQLLDHGIKLKEGGA